MSLKRNMLSVALASALFTVAANARAAEADAAAAQPSTATDAADADPQQAGGTGNDQDTLETVVVTGIRAGIESAIEAKKDSSSIVEVVSAEDLGKLPDISIADSIARLPGLASQRVAGRSSTISIRGLSGDYGTTLLNGREQVSVGDNRTVEFDQFPSELINQVVVYKTPDASLVGQGLSGTVDLRTIRPLAFQERTMSVNVRGEKNSLGKVNSDSDDLGSRFSAFYLDQFLDHRLGIALGYARLDSPGQSERWESWGYPNDNGGSPGNYVIGGAKIQGTSTSNVRQGAMGVLEFNANEVYSTTLDLYYSKFDKSETTRFMETPMAWGGGTALVNPVVRDGVVVGGSFTGVRPVLRNDLNEGNDKLFAIGWNSHFNLSYDWTANLDISHSKADRNESILEMYSGTRAGVTDTVDFSLDPSGFPNLHYGLDYSDPNLIVLTDPGGWGQDGYIKTPQVTDELTSFRADAERAFNGPVSAVKFGINYADRSKERKVPEAFLDLIQDETTVPAGFLISPVDLSFAGIGGNLSYEINPVLGQFYTLRDNINADIANKQWKVDEEVTTGYVQVDINTEVGSLPLTGNIGVQAVSVDQESHGFEVLQGDAANAVPFDGKASYTDYLPSLNLALKIPGDNTLRLGLGREAARPRLDQMRANNNTSLEFSGVNQGLWTRNGGNPDLKPWIANALDLSFEHYFDKKGYFALAYFYKDLKTYVYDQTGTFDASGLPIPDGYTGPTPDPVGYYTRPTNGTGGNVKGWEATLSFPFELVFEPLDGFGLIANFSDTDSSIKRQGPDGPDEPIAGLSRQVRNFALYYEKYGFQARASVRSRSAFLGEIQGFGADRALVYIDGESVVDLQTGYTFPEDSALKGMTVLLQVNNLTDEPYRQYFPGNGLTQRTEKYGKQYLLGVNYKF